MTRVPERSAMLPYSNEYCESFDAHPRIKDKEEQTMADVKRAELMEWAEYH